MNMYSILPKQGDEKRFAQSSWIYANYLLNQDYTKDKNIICDIGSTFNKIEVGAILKKYTYLRIIKNEAQKVMVRLEN